MEEAQPLTELMRRIPVLCPRSRARLQSVSDSSFACPTCGRSFGHLDGLLDLSTQAFYWNQLGKKEMIELNRCASQLGWETALSRHILRRLGRYVYDYARLESRADFHFQLPLDPDAEILDIGAGWGQ